ncbi:helix-turn-helix domain-containing protein [Paraburkholderia sp. J69-2]|uniref:AraC-like ligand-binding domain-containing protein n=1 Tax=Paraburkholderia sp. J69-2 TaxID=2805437 RepID=UPI002AB189A7|nr:helix-turn-helix domain-containing protein [Paraburkholderia sp. J69-2]
MSLATCRWGLIVKTYVVDRETPRSQKIDSWLHLLREMFVKLEYVSSDEATDQSLTAKLEHRTLSNLDVRSVASTKQTLQRVPQRAADYEGEYFLVVLQISGTGGVTQDGRKAVLRPGDFAMYDTTRAYALEFDTSFEQLVVSIPRDQLRTQVPSAEILTACQIPGEKALGRLLRDMVCGLPCTIDETTDDTHPFVAHAVVDLIAANLRALQPAPGSSPSKLQRYQEERIKDFIQKNATDSELTVTKLAQALDMSVSAVYRAFESQDVSVAEMIWLERLRVAREVFRNSAFASKSIKEIAFESGFSDAAHFSRAFRQRYGISPREFRARD